VRKILLLLLVFALALGSSAAFAGENSITATKVGERNILTFNYNDPTAPFSDLAPGPGSKYHIALVSVGVTPTPPPNKNAWEDVTINGALTDDAWALAATILGDSKANTEIKITTTANIPDNILTGGVSQWSNAVQWRAVWAKLGEYTDPDGDSEDSLKLKLNLTLNGLDNAANSDAMNTLVGYFSEDGVIIETLELRNTKFKFPAGGLTVGTLNVNATSTVDLSAEPGLIAGTNNFTAGATIIVPDDKTIQEIVAILSDSFDGANNIPSGLKIVTVDERDVTAAVYAFIAVPLVKPTLPAGTPPEVKEPTVVHNAAPGDLPDTFKDSLAPGGATVTDSVAREAAGVGGSVEVLPLPIFKAEIETAPQGNVAAVGFEVKGSDLYNLNATTARDIRLIKILSPTTSVPFVYESVPAQFGDKKFTLLRGGQVYEGSIANDGTVYTLVVFIRDSGDFDLDEEAAPNGTVVDPTALVASKNGGGSGCGAGSGSVLALLALAGMCIARKRLR